MIVEESGWQVAFELRPRDAVGTRAREVTMTFCADEERVSGKTKPADLICRPIFLWDAYEFAMHCNLAHARSGLLPVLKACFG